ncbi:MAG: TonB-dependent receptor [Flavobacteriaceae bacterium]|nr:TonB-dependent receptor [Flavobacteriaceae bacterium]
MKEKIYSILFALLLTLPVLAQSGSVSGTVTDSDGQPMPGVSVIVKGTSTGTTTDFDGKYSVSAASDATLVFSYVGFESANVKVNGRSTVDVALQSGVALDEVVVIGSRNKNRTVTDSPVPVDVIDVKQLMADSPQTSLNQILNYVAPSFTSNTQTISDGTDHIDPASLRGLGPDQVLVLINGKRRHSSSLVNVNGTFGRGSVGTDLNAIPTAAIERIEVLRDGAASQYGSDAIAGVINIVMKKITNTVLVTSNTGAYASKFSGGWHQGGTDGETSGVSINYGLPLGENGGFVNFTGMYDSRNRTNRMIEWEGKIFQGYNAVERMANNDGYDLSQLLLPANMADVQSYAQQVPFFSSALKADINAASDIGTLRDLLKLDITTDELAARGLQRKDFNMKVGQSALRSGKAFFNMELPTGDEGTIYAFGGVSNRNGDAAGFYRLPYQSRAYTPAYINGFLPEIHSNVIDKSIAAGIRGKIGDWDVDFSQTWGQNKFGFDIQNTANATLQNATAFEFNAGGFAFTQTTTNFDMSKYYEDEMEGLNLAFGAEYRLENYEIFAGEEGSYAKYDILGNIVTSPDADPALTVRDFYGNARPGGSQVFPGFSPANELSKYRSSYATYADVEAQFTKSFLLTGALRFENYSDFGNTTTFKLATQIKASDNFSLRSSLNTGFRAPSLHQLNFNSTSTIFVDGIPTDVGTFSNDSRAAKLLGIPKLKQEESTSFSAGFTGKMPDANIKFTVDAYYVKIKDRVVYTGSFKPGTNAELISLFSQANAGKAAFFANAIDTKSTGLDIVITHNGNLGEGKLRTDFSATFSKTQQVGPVKASPVLEAAGLTETYFDQTSRIYLEKAVPRAKANLTFNYAKDKFNMMLRNVYFGPVTEATNNIANQQEFSSKVVTDLTFGYKLSDTTKFTFGANNILDVYPDAAIQANRSSGRFNYSRRSQQFGANGRFIFARLTFSVKE